MKYLEVQPVIDATTADVIFFDIPASSQLLNKPLPHLHNVPILVREFVNPANSVHGFVEVDASCYEMAQTQLGNLLIDVKQNGLIHRTLVESAAKTYYSADHFVTRLCFSLIEGWT